MRVYLASPGSRQHYETVRDMDVLISYAVASPKTKIFREYQPTLRHFMVDSGAFSELNSGMKIDLNAYAAWVEPLRLLADAIAGLDDISGDWRRSLVNYSLMPSGIGFPTFHDTDPPELLKDLIPIARERGHWLGLGIKPPRGNKESWVRRSCDQIPEDLHVHGWALREYTHVRRLDSVDSTSWWRKAFQVRLEMPWLTYGECLEIIVKKYQRFQRVIRDPDLEQTNLDLLE